MPAPRIAEALLYEALDAYQKCGGRKSDAARSLGIDRRTFTSRLHRAATLPGVNLKKLAAGGKVEALKTHKAKVPTKADGTKRYILSSIQNNTKVWPGVHNLIALADHYGAEMLVGTFTYNKAGYASEGSAKRGSVKASDTQGSWYDPEVERFISDKRIQLAPGLVWCGEMNILPTASDPLSGFETYAGRNSCIFPHTRHELRSIISGKYEGTKMNYTTGTVGQRNYIQKRAGLRAEESHVYGGLIVEVKPSGAWFVRQLQAGPDDEIYDLNLRAQAGIVEEFDPESGEDPFVDNITWGDIHEISLETRIRELMFGKGGILDTYRPRYQFMHDVLDFRSRNHHDMRNSHLMFKKHVTGVENVEREVRGVKDFLATESFRPWCETVVVPSNHDEALTRWLREADFKADPINSIFYLERELAHRLAIRAGNDRFIDLQDAVVAMGGADVNWLCRDDSFVTNKRRGFPGIEHGLHGDTWANLLKYGRPLTIGHRHGAGVFGQLWVAGISGALDQGYNVGPSNWSQSHVFEYRNGCRTVVTIWNGEYKG